MPPLLPTISDFRTYPYFDKQHCELHREDYQERDNQCLTG